MSQELQGSDYKSGVEMDVLVFEWLKQDGSRKWFFYVLWSNDIGHSKIGIQFFWFLNAHCSFNNFNHFLSQFCIQANLACTVVEMVLTIQFCCLLQNSRTDVDKNNFEAKSQQARLPF